MLNRNITGMDVHGRSVNIAMLDTETGEIRHRLVKSGKDGGCVADADVLDVLLEAPSPIKACYEAGPTGYHLYRFIKSNSSIDCLVIAPNKVPDTAPKTDKRDASNLARQLMAGSLSSVYVPTEEMEGRRDLGRMYLKCSKDARKAGQIVSSMLLKEGYGYDGRTWTDKHRAWINNIRLNEPLKQYALECKLSARDSAVAIKAMMESKISDVALTYEDKQAILNIMCLKGISLTSAFIICSEIGNFNRLSYKTIASYIGLVPKESSSGEKRSLGKITKAGNGNIRKLLVEAANTIALSPFNPNRLWFKNMKDKVSEQVYARAALANTELSRRYRDLTARGVKSNKAKIAVARRMSQWILELATSM